LSINLIEQISRLADMAAPEHAAEAKELIDTIFPPDVAISAIIPIWFDDAVMFQSAMQAKYHEAMRHLNAIRLVAAGKGMRCYLPPTLANESLEVIQENIDPWISLCDHYRYWIDEFGQIIEELKDKPLSFCRNRGTLRD